MKGWSDDIIKNTKLNNKITIMNKQQRLQQLKKHEQFELDLIKDLKEKIERATERLIDIHEEMQEIERDIDIEDGTYLSDKIAHDNMLQEKADKARKEYMVDKEQKYGDFTGVTNEDR